MEKDNLIAPEYILIYWHGPKMPSWRQDNIDRLVSFYPNAQTIESYSGDRTGFYTDSDLFRFGNCATHRRCLWVDNDIWLDSPLELTESPALADEYHCGHWSICWSGDRPDMFFGENANTIQKKVKRGEIGKLKITGTHWASNLDGSRAVRTY